MEEDFLEELFVDGVLGRRFLRRCYFKIEVIGEFIFFFK